MTNTNQLPNQEFDYVILGAGSAGCVLANRLSEDGSNTVAVLEAGPVDNKLLIHVPAGVYSVYRDPSINWNYLAEPEDAVNGRQVELPRGKVLGGSSSINSMVYMRGHPLDYDRWASEHGLSEWSYDQCLPYFRRCETSDRGESEYRGGSGPLGVSRSKLDNPLFDAMLLAGEQSGQGVSDDLNGYKPEGIARLDSTTRNGRRCSAAVAHLKPALARANVTLTTHALVQRILIENQRATGVEYEHRGTRRTVRAAKAVLVCCGAIKSPQLLMLSGIGPAARLREHNIDIAHELAGVGENLQDHLYAMTGFESKQDVTLHKLTNPLRKLHAGVEWLLTRKGVASSNIWEMGGFVSSNHETPYPNTQYHFAPVYSQYTGRKIKLVQGYQLHADQLRPKSRGHVRLRSADPQASPAATFNYLSDPHDVKELREGFKMMQELLTQPAFDEFRGARLSPVAGSDTDDEIDAYIRQTVSTDYHPCGTCAMGHDDAAVVDSQMRVRGVDGLRVVDASVMPSIVSGNLNAPTQMIAERAADFILGKPQLASEHVRFHFQ